MQRKVLVIEDSAVSMNLVTRLVQQAKLMPICAATLTEAKHLFSQSNPEEFLCAVVDYHLPDAPHGEAIDYAIASFVPTIVITGRLDEETRTHVLSKEVVDYIPKENTQVYDYLSRLLARMEKNKHIGVLVVDHMRSSRTSMASLLRRHNFETFEASSAQEGLDILHQRDNVQLIVTDFKVPDMNGTQFVAELRKSWPKEQLAIIGVSSGNSALLSARFIKSGANDFLQKPYCHEEFLVRIMQNVEYIENVETIRRAANSDYLTGLPNRRHFFYSVNHVARTSPALQSVALIDLDHFKRVNDQFGHDAGDKVLKEVAKLIANHFSDHNVSRFGGEEFCLYFANVAAEEVDKSLESFRRAVRERPIRHQQQDIPISASIGVTHQGRKNLDAMLAKADELLYRAKSSGRNQLQSDLLA
ncbi:diguanylate cyclase [Alteromonas oceanisediminis]|uniref:diguanylate cyclase n=1 Tax=Alteromonas oceanisediminis TaxID=2836180 RepID=UPI001BD9F4CE|nr:diguanylate cyclase [Alteromonas oceanisediminis]MBT0586840.1 diguanylate cyclase [Alteromonas oceanisediminis]